MTHLPKLQAGARPVSRPSAPEFCLLLADDEGSLRQITAFGYRNTGALARGDNGPQPSPALLQQSGGSCSSVKCSFSPPTLGERRHRRFARRLVAVDWRAVLVVTVGECPQPGLAHRRGGGLHDAADHDAAGEHVVVVLAPLARQAGGRRALE